MGSKLSKILSDLRPGGIEIRTMALSNYRDISPPLGDVGAGFQFEFFCESCGDTWKTPFKPYRAGQANGVFRRFGYLFNEFAKISVISEIDLSPRPRGRHVDRGDRLQGQGGGARRGAGAGGAALREVQQLPDDGLRQLLRRGDPALRQVRSRAGRGLAERHLGQRVRPPSVRIARRPRRAGASATSAASTWRARTRAVRPAARRCLARRGSAPIAATASSARRGRLRPPSQRRAHRHVRPTNRRRSRAARPAIRRRRSST